MELKYRDPVSIVGPSEYPNPKELTVPVILLSFPKIKTVLFVDVPKTDNPWKITPGALLLSSKSRNLD
jgi:hypothetical protein